MPFCIECGTKLPDAAKFCPECGTKTQAPVAEVPAAEAPPAETPVVEAAPSLPPELREKFESVRSELQGERREVVVLFGDLKGFTSLSEQLDAEDITFLINRLMQSLAKCVYEYEGYVDKFIGDAIMALFGAPLAHENDPERAVLAGLRMQEVLERHNAESHHTLALRVGINLGEVVAAHLGSEMDLQYTVLGDTVNVASRLEGAAEPNTVLVSDAVWRRIQRRFDGVEVPPLTLKGKSEPISAWRVEGYRARRKQRRERTPFVGREAELERLRTVLGKAAGGAMTALVVVADTGIGKSRLVRETLQGWEGEVIEVAFSQIHLPGQRPPAIEVFRALAEDPVLPPIERARARLGSDAEQHERGLAGLQRELDPESADPASADEDPAAARQNRWLAVAALIRAVSRERPLALAFEDLHWTDEADQEFLRFLVETLHDSPVAILMTSRRADLGWLPDEVERLDVDPLDESTAERLLGDLLAELPPEERRDLIRRSAGNPLYLEELARALAEDGERRTAVPGMLQGLIMSRVDRLDPPLQHLLQMASVLGGRFSLELLARMFRITDQPIQFDTALAGLEEREFLEVGEPGSEGRFLHGLTQEVTYGGLLKKVRRVLHESAAHLGEEQYADRLEAEAAFFAHHYWHADLPKKATPHLWTAGRSAADSWDLPTAETLLGRAAETIAGEEEILAEEADRARFEETYGHVLMHRGDLDTAETWFRRLEERGAGHAHAEWQARGIEYQGRIAWYRGLLDEAQARFERGLEVIGGGSDRLAADLHGDLGIVLYYRRRADESYEQHSRALALRETLGDRLGMAKTYSNIGNLLMHLKNDLDGADQHYRRAYDMAEAIGDRQMMYSALNNLGLLQTERGEWTKALETLGRAEAILAEIGWSFARFVTLQNRAWCEIHLGRLGNAWRQLNLCIEKGDPVLGPLNRLNTRLYLFDVLLRGLAFDRAEALLDECRAIVAEHEIKDEIEEVHLRAGRLLSERGRWVEARKEFEAAEEVARGSGDETVELLARAHACRAAARAGQESPESPDLDAAGANAPLRTLMRYLLADARAARGDLAAEVDELAAIVAEAEALGDVGVERAAAELLADAREAAGDAAGAREALERVVRAMDFVAQGLPPELQPAFEAHPETAALRERLGVASRGEPR